MNSYKLSPYQVPPFLEKIIALHLQQHRLKLTDTKKIAESIKTLSDYYIDNPHSATPWEEAFTQIAYSSYYLPLNFIRSLSLYREINRLDFAKNTHHLLDFGSGTGAGSLPFITNNEISINSLTCIETSEKAIGLHKSVVKNIEINSSWHHCWDNNLISPEKKSLGLFSYSLTELNEMPPWIEQLDHLVFIEPSTRADGRRLMEWRAYLQNKGFYIWGPCTHQNPCPLLEQSKKDWCHHRIHWQQPPWFQNIEKQLTIKNKTLTYSYLLASREAPKPFPRNTARTTGDSLKEKGKIRQLICRGPQREFLTWLKKNNNAQEIPRGTLVKLPDELDIKANELRVPPQFKIEFQSLKSKT